MAQLLEELRAAGAGDALQALLARDHAAQVSLHLNLAGRRGVARLLTALRGRGWPGGPGTGRQGRRRGDVQP